MQLTKALFLITGLLFSYQSFSARGTKKHETCVYSEHTLISDPLYKFSKDELMPKLEMVKKRAQELCIGFNGVNKYPDNGIGECLYYSDIAKKGKYKGKRVMCVKHSCLGFRKEMDDPCKEFNLEKAPQSRARRDNRRESEPPK
ncbi:MAG: hypothetical protein OEY33_04560 [Bdellovibrionales bacterium]|nr:hypothetical protein [Bdellovibrionales bacterium]